jgi:hypothetical protein
MKCLQYQKHLKNILKRELQDSRILSGAARRRWHGNTKIGGIERRYRIVQIHQIGQIKARRAKLQLLFACDWPFAPDRAVEMNVKGFESLRLTKAERLQLSTVTQQSCFPNLCRDDRALLDGP